MAELKRATLAMSAVLAVAFGRPARAQTSLPAYNVDPSKVTVAGVSSGGFMAVQLHVAYSSHIHGAAIFAGGPYYCAQDSETTASGNCESGSGLSLQTYVNYTSQQAAAGTIDSPSNLANQPVYLFSGTADTTVAQASVDMLQEYYANYSSTVTYDNNTDAAHGWISPDGPNACDSSYSPYINNCSIDPEQTFLTEFYGTLAAKNTGTLGGSFVQFDQSPFCAGGSCSAISLDSSGWAYVPASCAGGASCKLIVVIHGCFQSQGSVGQDLVKESGLNEWADTNDLIVLYPQATTASSNPEGCWDWWGYTGANYAVQSGPQMSSVMAMVDHLTGQAPSTSSGSSSSSSGSSSGSAACTSLGLACSGGATCCGGSSCQYGFCLPSFGSSSSGSSGGTGSSQSASTSSSSSGTGSSGAASSSSSSNSSQAAGSSSGATSSTSSAASSTGGASGSTGTLGSSGSAFAPALSLSSVTPAGGSSLAPTSVTLAGAGFQPWAQVMVGAAPVTGIDVQSAAVLDGVVPAGLPGGSYDVTVIDPDGSQTVLKGAFTVVEPSGGCSTGGSTPTPLLLLAAILGLTLLRRRRAAALALGLALALSANLARADEHDTTDATEAPAKPVASATATPAPKPKPAILGPAGAMYVGAAVNTTPAVIFGLFPIDHLALTGGLALTFNGNGGVASPLTGVKGTTASQVGSDLFLDAIYFVHDRAPFAMGPELNWVASLAPYNPLLVNVLTPMWALRYAPWNAPIAIGTGFGVAFAMVAGTKPVVSLATQGLDIVYAF